MAERSILWPTGGVGDGSAEYTETDWTDFLRRTFCGGSANLQGILKGYNNELVVSGTASPLSVATGAAVVYGFPYESTSVESLTVATPSVGTTGGRVVLRADWAARTVRVVAVRSADGVLSAPGPTQVAGTTWEITLATFTITTGGVITLADGRNYCAFATEVQTENLANLAVTTTKLDNLAVTSGKLANGAVVAGKLGNDAVATANIQDGAVTSAEIADGTIATGDLADGAVTSAKIADGTIVAGDLASDAVTNSKIQDGAVTAGKLGTDSVTNSKIQDGAVTTSKIQDVAVTAAKLATDSVTTVKIVDANVTAAKPASNSVTTTKITDANVTTAKLADDAVTEPKIGAEVLAVAKRQGGDATDWGVAGTTGYSVANVRIEFGIAAVTILSGDLSAEVTVNFVTNFTTKPRIALGMIASAFSEDYETAKASHSASTDESFVIYVTREGSTSGEITRYVDWIAIGEI